MRDLLRRPFVWLLLVSAFVIQLGCPPPKGPVVDADVLPLEHPLEGVDTRLSLEAGQMFARGWANFENKAFGRAWDDFQDALRLESGRGGDGTLYPIFTALAYCAMMEGQTQAPEELFDRSLAVQPKYYQALSGLGLLFQRRGLHAKAFEHYSLALAVNPEGRSAKLGLGLTRLNLIEEGLARGRSLASEGRLDEAAEEYRKIIAVAPELTAAHYELASSLERVGRLDEAMVAYRRGLANDPDNLSKLLRLAELAERSGQLAEAARTYARVIRLDPSNEDARQGYQRALMSERSRDLPDQLSGISHAQTVEREEIAALLAYKLPLHQRRGQPAASPIIIIDVHSSWAKRYIQEVVAAGLMRVYDNHTFRPTHIVSRLDMAGIAGRVIDKFIEDGMIAEKRAGPLLIQDLPPEHMMYDTVREVLERGIMSLAAEDRFEPYEPVSGQEAVGVVERLVMLLR